MPFVFLLLEHSGVRPVCVMKLTLKDSRVCYKWRLWLPSPKQRLFHFLMLTLQGAETRIKPFVLVVNSYQGEIIFHYYWPTNAAQMEMEQRVLRTWGFFKYNWFLLWVEKEGFYGLHWKEGKSFCLTLLFSWQIYCLVWKHQRKSVTWFLKLVDKPL